MKKALIIILMLGSWSAYTQGIEYLYDAAGNRYQRKVFVLTPAAETGRLASDEQSEISEELIPGLKLTIYPNPVKETLHLRATGEFQSYKMTIYDLTGKTMLNTSVNQPNKQINVSHFSKGTYIIRTRVGEQFTEWKMVKQ